MAGDTKTTDPRERLLAPDFQDPFPGILETLQDIRDQLRGSIADGPGVFDITAQGLIGFARHEWQRIRASHVIVSASAAGTAILTVGTFARTWNIGVGVSVIPLPITIERGGDVTLGGTAAGIVGYLIGTAE